MFGEKKIPEWIQKVVQNLNESKLQPIFANEVLVSGMVKGTKDKDGNVTKEANVMMVFVDMTNLQPIGKYVVSVSTASGLINALRTQLDQLEKQIQEKELLKEPEQQKITPASGSEDLTYIG